MADLSKKFADNLKIVSNLLNQCTLPPTPVGKAGEVAKVVAALHEMIGGIDAGNIQVTDVDLPDDIDFEEVVDESEQPQ